MAYSKEDKEKKLNSIFKSIENGLSLRKSLIENKLDVTTFYAWIDADEEKSKQYAKMKENELYKKAISCKANIKGSKAITYDDYRRLNARLVNKAKFTNSNLYIFKIKNENIYKIGVSQNVNRRFKDISNALPYESEIIFNKQINNAYDLEEYLHNKYKDKYMKSEWFKNIDLEDCLTFINQWQVT